MAKKVLNPLEDPPTASSSNDEEEVESSSSGEEEEQEQQQQQQLSISDEPKDPSPKPLKTPSTAAAAAPSSGSEKKRASEEANEEHAKRAKTLSQKSPFARIWSEDDEISLLQGMIRFKAEKGTSPYDDMNGFFLVTKDSISFDATKTQFVEKIRSLKNKYCKGKDSRSFLKPHDVKCFKLASCIWGSDDGVALLDSAPPVAVKSPPVDVISNKVDKKKKKKLEFGDEEMQVLGSDDGMALLDSAPPVAVTLAVKSPPVAVISNKVVDKKKKKKKLEVEDKEMKVLGSDDGMALLDSAPAVKSPPVPVISNQVDKKNKKKKKKLEVEDEKVQVLGSDGMVLESAAVVKANGSLKLEGDMVEKDKEVVVLDGDSESSALFDKSFLVPSIVSLGGVDECSVKHKWSKVPMETKKRIEDKLKLVEAKEFELLLQKSDIVKEVASVFTQAI